MKAVQVIVLLGLCLTIHGVAFAGSPYNPTMKGALAGYRLAGIEPDGDPLYETVMNTTLRASGNVPRVHLIVNAYLENFKPDTTPILPDLLHPKQQAHNLGGFLQGKALITDDAGNVISIGGFIAEAFLDNSNSAVMTLYSGKSGYGAAGKLEGRFTLNSVSKTTVAIQGAFSGTLTLSPAARNRIHANAGAHMKPIEKIISQVTVTPHAMVGRATAKSRSVPLRTGFHNGSTKANAVRPTPKSSGAGIHLSMITIVAAIGAILSFLMAAFLFFTGRRTAET
jgi:hypothetical protein